MPPSSRWNDDRGSASLEFLAAGLVLLVPLVYLVLAMSAIQSGALAVEGGARQAARVFVQSRSAAEARDAASRAVQLALADHAVRPQSLAVHVSCAPHPNDCLTRRGLVTVAVELTVPLPFVPPALPGDFALTIPLRAEATQQVSRFWSDE